MLFGYAINTTPRYLPTAVLLQEQSDCRRSILAALRTPNSSRSRKLPRSKPSSTRCSPPAPCCSRLKSRPASSARCGAATTRRCWSPPTPPIRSPPALRWARFGNRGDRIVSTTAGFPTAPAAVRNSRPCALQPGGVTQLNIVPGLLGTILTMTMLIFTALSVTREIERGTMESLLAMPITPFEIMIGKIAPYVLVGFVQAALIIGAGVLLFGVPIVGNLGCLPRSPRCSSPPTCRSATPSRPWRRTSCRRCRCR